HEHAPARGVAVARIPPGTWLAACPAATPSARRARDAARSPAPPGHHRRDRGTRTARAGVFEPPQPYCAGVMRVPDEAPHPQRTRDHVTARAGAPPSSVATATASAPARLDAFLHEVVPGLSR